MELLAPGDCRHPLLQETKHRLIGGPMPMIGDSPASPETSIDNPQNLQILHRY